MLIKRKSIEAESNLRGGPKAAATRPARRKPRFAPITLSESDGIRYLHFGTEWVQGAMRVRKPDWLELEYSQQMMAWMLFQEAPARIAQLGLGSAAITKFCYRQFPEASVQAVELNPEVINVARAMFKLPQDDERLEVLEMDAMDFVSDRKNHKKLDILQVDLYDATARGPVLDSPEFYKACADCLKLRGIMTVNLFGGGHRSFLINRVALDAAFEQVIYLPEIHDGNVIAIAFKKAPRLNWKTLHERAAAIRAATKLPADSWVSALQEAISEEESNTP
ncbi:spermidine synthase [Undibacterium luofuense]|uniref:Spermidine synthase n=1 Tax=Undibacterium luofuense TaxID=2828733 RepID=A0A941DMU3_9BURK|nr:spermidine synthase [Undibacterium luofuense]MBR7783708.1 spermidine synthase [Undibacterium luofuense]